MAGVPRGLERLHGEVEPGLLLGRNGDRHPSGQGHGFGVGGPIRGGDEDLVTGVEQGGERFVHGLLGAVGHEHLGGHDLVARVPHGLGRHGLAQRGQPGGGAVVVVGRHPAGLDGGLHDVLGRGEVGLARPEADNVFPRSAQRPGLGVDGQRGRG